MQFPALKQVQQWVLWYYYYWKKRKKKPWEKYSGLFLPSIPALSSQKELLAAAFQHSYKLSWKGRGEELSFCLLLSTPLRASVFSHSARSLFSRASWMLAAEKGKKHLKLVADFLSVASESVLMVGEHQESKVRTCSSDCSLGLRSCLKSHKLVHAALL